MITLVLAAFCLTSVAMSQHQPTITSAPDRFATQLVKRVVDCQGGFRCDRGTCYRGDDGFVGCCSVSSCAPRTTCIEYADLEDNGKCDHNTGGCVVCSKSEAPYCVTITNIVMKEYAMYCDVVSNLTDIKTISYAKTQVAATTTHDEIETTTDARFQTATIYDDTAEDPDTSSVPSTTDEGNASNESSQDSSMGNAGESSGVTHSKGSDAATSVSEDQEITQTSTHNSESHHSNRNTIIGSVVGVIGGIILALLGAWCFKRLRRKPAPPPQCVQPAPFLQLAQISPDMQASMDSHYNYQSPNAIQHTSISPTSLSFVGSSVTGAPTQAFGSMHELHGNGENSQTSSRNWYRHEPMTTGS
ncbi:hypothetical protein EDB81DRAFT_855825 [Dactylonectria macrodidyma]|uniref:Mid2 domain-containing protein n=1 Tax=Dactylonectria macrodidyma TaxID=307937 RepID=A0A9P9JC77_9HYPO|nr:hypothetical protein EDB81DRAFT_855825 [Dactylonectria macrodidyma]